MPDDIPDPDVSDPPSDSDSEPVLEPESRRERLKSKALQLQRDWKGIAFPEGEGPWFAPEDVEYIAPFDPETTVYTPANAWWLVELCRLAYTPDDREKNRPWSRFDRLPHLERSPFRELHSIHKTGTHAAIYRVDTGKKEDAATVLCFRGTTKMRQWVMNLSTLPVAWQGGGDGPDADDSAIETKTEKAYVHQGFQILFDRIWPLLEPLLRDQPRPLFITGHSLGAALALMSAARMTPEVLYTFGSPRVGNPTFTASVSGFPHFRVVHHHDIVTLLPHAVETFAPYDFRHHGELVHLRSDEVDWQPDKPLTYLRKTFTSADPPECFVDHTPIMYAETLIKCSQ
jgi:hypothetical protein